MGLVAWIKTDDDDDDDLPGLSPIFTLNTKIDGNPRNDILLYNKFNFEGAVHVSLCGSLWRTHI